MRGYPGVGLLDASAVLMNVAVVRVAGTVRTVVLHPWEALATARRGWPAAT